MKKNTKLFGLVIIMFFFSAMHLGCHKKSENEKPKTEKNTEIKTPQKEQSPPLTRYDKDGVIRIAQRRVFNAALPYTAKEVGCNDEFCEFFTDLNRDELIRFFLKYFPTQQFTEYPKVNRIYLSAKTTIKDSDPMVRSVMERDKGVILPQKGLGVEIKSYWMKNSLSYRLIYYNPSYKAPEIAVPKEIKEAMEQFDKLPPDASFEEKQRLISIIEGTNIEGTGAEAQPNKKIIENTTLNKAKDNPPNLELKTDNIPK